MNCLWKGKKACKEMLEDANCQLLQEGEDEGAGNVKNVLNIEDDLGVARNSRMPVLGEQ